MADNVAITPGAGATIATDDVSGVQFQRIKITDGTDGVAANHAKVNDAGKLAVAARTIVKKVVTPTVSTSIYTAGDCLGGLQTISAASPVASGTGVVQLVTMLDKTQAQRPAVDLMFFDATVTPAGDNSPVAFSDTDMEKCIAIISIPGYNQTFPGTPLNSHATLFTGLPFVSDASGNLYVQAVVRNTPTLTSTSDIVFQYTIIQD